MPIRRLTLFTALAALSIFTAVQIAGAADQPAAGQTPPAADAKPAAAPEAGGATPAAGGAMTPGERVKATEKGQLKNPFANDPKAVEEGRKLYMANSCNGCHGGGGGGGMCPPLTNEVWVYGKDDDTLFRLITLGSKELQAAGYKRKGSEGVVGRCRRTSRSSRTKPSCGRSSPGSARLPRSSRSEPYRRDACQGFVGVIPRHGRGFAAHNSKVIALCLGE